MAAGIVSAVVCPHTDRKQNSNGLCRNCYDKKWRLENHEKTIEAQRRYRKRHPDWILAHVEKYKNSIKGTQSSLYHAARRRARAKNIPFDITARDIDIPVTCPLLGVVLKKNKSASNYAGPASPSLDRIVPSLGYVKGNIRVISFRANVIKQDATLEELKLLVKNWKALENQ